MIFYEVIHIIVYLVIMIFLAGKMIYKVQRLSREGVHYKLMVMEVLCIRKDKDIVYSRIRKVEGFRY